MQMAAFLLCLLQKRTNLSVLVTSELDKLSIQDSLPGARVQRCGSPVATSKGRRHFEAPTEPTGETSSLQGSRVKPLPSDMMLCVISYWIYYLAQNGGRSSSFAASFSPGKMLKRRLEKSFIIRLFTYNK